MLLDLNNNSWRDNWGEDVNVKMCSDVTLAVRNENNSVSLFDVYDPGLGVRRKVVNKGIFDPTGPNCSFSSTDIIYSSRKNMTGVVLRVAFLVATNLTVPLTKYLKDRHNKNENTISKFNYELFEHVVEEYNFTLVLQ